MLDLVWSYDAFTESNVVDTYVHYLRASAASVVSVEDHGVLELQLVLKRSA